MDGGFDGPRIPPAGSLSVRTESDQRIADTHGFGLPFIHPGFLEGLRHPCPFDW